MQVNNDISSFLEAQKGEKPLYRRENVLKYLYLQQKLSTNDISSLLNCGQATVSRWLEKHKIPTRNTPVEQKIDKKAVWENPDKPWTAWAEEINAHPSSVSETMRKKGWLRGDKKTPLPTDLDIPDVEPWKNSYYLRELYLKYELSILQIADLFNTSKRQIHSWMDRYNIPKRGRNEKRTKTLIRAPCSICKKSKKVEDLTEDRVCKKCDYDDRTSYQDELKRFLERNPHHSSQIQRSL